MISPPTDRRMAQQDLTRPATSRSWRDRLPPWPTASQELVAVQEHLAAEQPEPWHPPPGGVRSIAGCFVCFPRERAGPGAAGDPAWAAAVWLVDDRVAAVATVAGHAPASYEPGLLALREGPLLETALRALPGTPEVLLVNATGRDHPRRAGLALHLGARLGVPTVGVTRAPLLAWGERPADVRGAMSPLRIDEELVGYWVRTKPGTHPLAAHAAWRTDPATAAAVVLAAAGRWRTPEPLRLARRAARALRAGTAVRGHQPADEPQGSTPPAGHPGPWSG